MTRDNELQPLATLGSYALQERIGSGGMGSVYRAIDQRDGRVVALKLLNENGLSDPSGAERFRREAQVASLLHSPHVVRVLDYANDGRRSYMVSEFVDGPCLADVLKSGALPPATAAAIGSHIAAALVEAERHGVAHRDIKPGNVLIAPEGIARVTDFGIAAINHSTTLTLPGMFVGTAAYAAPEQHRGEADTRSDIYSLGVVLFEMLSGHLPFRAETVTGMMRLHDEAPVPVGDLSSAPSHLVRVIETCLQKNPALRFQHPAEVLSALASVQPVATPVAAVDSTVIAPIPGTAGLGTTVVAPAPAPSQSSVDATVVAGVAAAGAAAAVLQTGEWPTAVAASGGSSIGRHFGRMGTLRRAGIAAAAVAVVSVAALFAFRGSSEAQHASGGGDDWERGGRTILRPEPVVTETVTPPPSGKRTATPTREPIIPTATPEPATPTPTATTPPPTATPAPKKTAPAVPTPTVPPAPALAVVDYAFCHPGCPYGAGVLGVGYAIAVGFELNQLTYQQISADVYFNGVFYYTTYFSPSTNGEYYELLPHANEPGRLDLRINAGGTHIGTISANVSAH